jgi:hypothetical protein
MTRGHDDVPNPQLRRHRLLVALERLERVVWDPAGDEREFVGRSELAEEGFAPVLVAEQFLLLQPPRLSIVCRPPAGSSPDAGGTVIEGSRPRGCVFP